MTISVDSDTRDVDVLIVGGGLAGLAMADALLREVPSHRIHLLDAGMIGTGASSVPQAMVHPFPGLSLAPKPGYVEAFVWMSQWLETWAASEPDPSSIPWLWKTSILRPLFLQEVASQRLLHSFERSRSAYPSAWQVERLDARQVREQYPALYPTDGGIRIAPAYAVDMPVFLQKVSQTLQQRGLVISPQTKVLQWTRQHTQQGEKWQVSTSSGQWHTQHLIIAVGSGLRDWFPRLPLLLTGGELAAVSPPSDFVDHESGGLSGLVSYRGHIVPWPTRNWMLGATYWDNDPGPGEAWFSWSDHPYPLTRVPNGLALRQQLGPICPALQNAEIQHVWLQARTVLHPDREPVVGNVPVLPNVHVLGALASKGLLLASWLAHRWVRQWFHEEPIPAWVHTARFPKEMWQRA